MLLYISNLSNSCASSSLLRDPIFYVVLSEDQSTYIVGLIIVSYHWYQRVDRRSFN